MSHTGKTQFDPAKGYQHGEGGPQPEPHPPLRGRKFEAVTEVAIMMPMAAVAVEIQARLDHQQIACVTCRRRQGQHLQRAPFTGLWSNSRARA